MNMRILTTALLAITLLLGTSPGTSPAQAELTEQEKAVLLDADGEQVNREAPPQYRVRVQTSAGDIVVDVYRDWAPHGADRFYNLAVNKYFDGTRFFRIVPDFIVQWGIHGDPEVSAVWREAPIEDDEVTQSNKRGTLTFATAGPNTRTVQLFVNLSDNTFLDDQGFSPFGEVVEGMEVVEKLYADYGEQPEQQWIQMRGEQYLSENFPELDRIIEARIIEDDREAGAADDSEAAPAP
jgi:peptidyl-prolyl cis-trans isomerase A (cyclophilin A)